MHTQIWSYVVLGYKQSDGYEFSLRCETFNQPICCWGVSQVTNMSGMFIDAVAFKRYRALVRRTSHGHDDHVQWCEGIQSAIDLLECW